MTDSKRKTARILVIDDESDVRRALREILQRAGFDAVTAATGKEGLEKLQQERADLVITDVIMPGIDGVATAQQIRSEHPDMPIIVISGGGNVAPLDYEPGAISTSAYLASARNAGADLTLTKPFQRDELLSAIQGLLGD